MDIIITSFVEDTLRYARSIYGSGCMGQLVGAIDAGKTTAVLYAQKKLETQYKEPVIWVRGCADIPRIYMLHELFRAISGRDSDRMSMNPSDMLRRIVSVGQKRGCKLIVVDFHSLVMEPTVFELLEVLDCFRQAQVPVGMLVASMQIRQGMMPFANSYAGNTLLRVPLFSSKYSTRHEIASVLRAVSGNFSGFCARVDRQEEDAVQVLQKLIEATEGAMGRVIRLAGPGAEGKVALSNREVLALVTRGAQPF